MIDLLKLFLAKTDWMKTVIGISVMLIYYMIVRSLIIASIPTENREAIIHVLGTLDGVISMLVGYYFGSSKGSQEKTEIIKQQNEKSNP